MKFTPEEAAIIIGALFEKEIEVRGREPQMNEYAEDIKAIRVRFEESCDLICKAEK